MKTRFHLLVLIIGLFLFTSHSLIAQQSVRQSQKTKTAKGFAKELYEKARNLVEQNKYREAIESYTAAIDLDPDEPGAYVGRGDAKCELEKWRESIEDYDKAISIYTSWGAKKPKAEARESRGGNVTLQEFEAQGGGKAWDASLALGRVYFRRGIAKGALDDIAGACKDFREYSQWDRLDFKSFRICNKEQAEPRTPDTSKTKGQSVSSKLEGTRWQATHPGEIYSPILERSLSRQFFCSFAKQGKVSCSIIVTASSKIENEQYYDAIERRLKYKQVLIPTSTLPQENRVGTYEQGGDSIHIELSAYEIEATVKENYMEGEVIFKLESSQKARWVAKKITEDNSDSSQSVARPKPKSKSEERVTTAETTVSSAMLRLGTYILRAKLIDYTYGVRTEESLTVKLRVESVDKSGMVKASLFHGIQEGQLSGRVSQEGTLELKGLLTWSKKVAASTFTLESRITLKATVEDGKLLEGEYLMADTNDSSEKRVVFNSVTGEENH